MRHILSAKVSAVRRVMSPYWSSEGAPCNQCIRISKAHLDKQVKTLHKSHVRPYFANKLTVLKNMHWGFSAVFGLGVYELGCVPT